MSVSFCPSCSNMLKPEVSDENLVFLCGTCSTSYNAESNMVYSHILHHKYSEELTSKRKAEFDPSVSKTDKPCTNCGSRSVGFTTANGPDEQVLVVYSCNDCGHTWQHL
ncbi:hypothetical protein P9112_001487 [Eukaryota sp. TZLM1-RC]